MSSRWPSTVRMRPNSRTMSTKPLRNSGSPPVRRTLVIPSETNRPRHPEIVAYRELRELRPFAARAAIDAFVIAAIGDGDAQIADASSEFVGQVHAISSWLGCPIPPSFGGVGLSHSVVPCAKLSGNVPKSRSFASLRMTTQNVRGKEERAEHTARCRSAHVSFPSTGGVDVSLHTLGPETSGTPPPQP